MPREVISIAIGQGGVQLSNACWEVGYQSVQDDGARAFAGFSIATTHAIFKKKPFTNLALIVDDALLKPADVAHALPVYFQP